jgi:hypothetical protein
MAQATATSPVPSTAPTRTPYRVTLHHIECCNCNHGCNCQFGGYPDLGSCEFMLGFQVIEGQYGQVNLDGAKFVVACMYPKAIHEGNGQVALFIDEEATSDQVEALAAILSGQAGGMPWEALAGTITSFQGPIRKRIEMTVKGTQSGFRIPGILEMQQTPLKDSVSGNDKEVQIVYPKGGFMWDTGNVCTTAAMKFELGNMRFSHPGRYACSATAKWTNQA